jgi:CBS domain-containing protein
MRIAGVMTADPITADVSASIDEAARLILKYRVGGLPVVHRGHLAGVITQADLVARLVPRERVQWWRVLIDHERLARECQKARGTTVGEVMTRPAFFVASDDAIEAAAHLLRDYRVGRLPVVDHGRLVGIVTHSDLLRALVGAPPASARPNNTREAEISARWQRNAAGS